jgi:hypothetical protein
VVWLAGQGLPQVSPCHLMSRSEIGTPIASSRQSSGPAGRPAMPGEAVHRHVSRPGLAQHRCTAASACQGELAHGSAPAGCPGPELSMGRAVFPARRSRRSSVRRGQIKAARVWPPQGPFGAVTTSRCPRSHPGRQSSSMMGWEARVWLPVPCHPSLTRSAVDGDHKTIEKASAAGSGRRQAPDMTGAMGFPPPQVL